MNVGELRQAVIKAQAEVHELTGTGQSIKLSAAARRLTDARAEFDKVMQERKTLFPAGR